MLLIRGQDATAGLAANVIVKKSFQPTCKLDIEERTACDRKKVRIDEETPSEFGVELLDNRNLRQFENALSGEKGSAGSYLIPNSIVREAELARYAAPIPRLATIVRVDNASGDHVTPMIDDRTGDGMGQLLAENQSPTSTNSNALTLSAVIARPKRYYSGIVKAAFEWVNDAPDGMTLPITACAQRSWRALNYYSIKGTGASQPLGLELAATAVTANLSTAIVADDLLGLIGAVGDGHFDTPDDLCFMCSRSVLTQVQKLKDGQGRNLFSFDNMKLAGFPVVINSAMSAASSIASGVVSVLFGNFARVVVTQRREMRINILREAYAEADVLGFATMLRADVNLHDPGDSPIARLVH